ncbi:MAG TPA: hypothetical protein VH062_37200 [Polyangiaceae bacterium]|jgi:hypothetical protein|nr:hypothetical protein [Polyangiaceae bacterium]
MKTSFVPYAMGVVVCAGSVFACSSSDGNKGDATGSGGGGATPVTSTGGTSGTGAGNATSTGGSSIPASGTGGIAPIGSGGTPITNPGSGGTLGAAGTPAGGAPAGGVPAGGAPAGGAPGGGTAGAGGAPTTTCTSTSPVGPTVFGMFPAGDPSKKGSLAVTTTNDTGPGGMYTLYRPTDLTKNGPLFPVVTWGNGTGTTPSVYSFLLTQLASHGFIVIASNSMNVGMGTPPPMLDGVTWVFQQNCDATSPMYQHVDTAHVGATGHSQGAFATMTAGTDPRIVATAPIEGSLPAKLHGPSLLLCGGMDTTVGCMGAQSAFTGITGEPLMYAELLAASHTSWITDSITAQFGGGAPSPFVTVVTAWMRLFLMNDTSIKPMFYGTDCTLCKDTADWTIQQKML